MVFRKIERDSQRRKSATGVLARRLQGRLQGNLDNQPAPHSLCLMKLRTDLLKHLRPEDVMESVEANNHRYRPEPLFSQTGNGSLSSVSTSERASEVTRSTDLIRKLRQRADASGTTTARVK